MKGLIVSLFVMAGLGTLLLGIGCLKDSKRQEEISKDLHEQLNKLDSEFEELDRLNKRRRQEMQEQEERFRQLNQELMELLNNKLVIIEKTK